MMDFFNTAYNYFNVVIEFLVSGIYELIVEFLSMFVIFFMTLFFMISAAMMQISWDVAKSILDTLNVSAMINSAWGQVDNELMPYLSFFRLPEAFNNILSAYATRLVMKFTVPWF